MARQAHFQTHIDLPIYGMTCVTCWVEVLAVLRKMQGILDVQANTEKETLRLTFEPEKVSLKKIVEAIRKRGYDAGTPIRSNYQPPDPTSQAA